MVLDDGFGASFKNGRWVPRLLFSADELKDNFFPVEDPEEVATLLRAARTAVSSDPIR
jgi:hypothetical protein